MITSEEAIKIVNDSLGDYDEVSTAARIFLCEDIIEMGVENWLDKPLEELLIDMVGYIKKSAEEGIGCALVDADDHIDKDSMEEFCFMLTKRMISTYKSMAKYASMYIEIKDIAGNDQL